MVIGLATEMLLLDEVRRALAESGESWADDACTAGERATCFSRVDPAPGLAARIAAKKAAVQALGGGLLDLREIEVVSRSTGQPALELHGGARLAADRIGASAIHVTITHADHHALAVVLVEGRDP